MTRNEAWEILNKYNSGNFHIQHALTVEQVMQWFAVDQGFESEKEYWGIVGLLHDVDYEKWPDQHCVMAKKILSENNVEESIIHAVCSHAYGICSDVKPEKTMEKILFATDELTGLIGAIALMLPEKSVKNLQLKTLKKKFKDKAFAAGCSRDTIRQGAEMLGWDVDTLLGKTMNAMAETEDTLRKELKECGIS